MTLSWSEEGAFLARARADLLAPATRVDVETLCRLWRWDEATVICDRPSDLEDYPDLALRVRGAMGRLLRERALSPRRADPWGRSSAWETLYLLEPPRRDGFEVARPFVVRVDVFGDRVVAAVRLFGWAGLHVEDVAEALWNALAGGVSLRAGGRIRVPFLPRDVTVSRSEGVEFHHAPGRAELLFDTATVIRRGHVLTVDPASIPMAAVRRAASLAPWMELGLDHDEAALREACDDADYDMGGVTAASWTRFSIRRPDAPIPVYAFRGRVRMAGRIGTLAPYLALAETCGLGSHAALGFGRVRAVLY